ncbi:MAG: NAD(P)/FAD-dependent oxidoreductase [Candidatus Bathycorpusculaceae bacterium]
MKQIAIAGCGWTGSILAYKLPQLGYTVDVYERNKAPKAICACGIPTSFFVELAKNCGLNPEDYICWKATHLIGDLGESFFGKRVHVEASNLCTFNKQKFMEDLVNHSTATFHFGESFPTAAMEKYDLIIDATGTRELLGRLPQDQLFATYQIKAKFTKLPYDGFYFHFSNQQQEKYLWMFPLSEKEAYVGCGAKNGQHARERVEKFLKMHNAEILERQAKILRLNPPNESLPFYNGKIIGVGNSVGTITSLGEGNAPSAITAQLLTENINNPQKYMKQIQKKLGWLKHDHAAYNAWSQNKKLKTIYPALKIRKIYRKRFGLY